ncbi:carbohydrate-binding protein [Asanoa sp. NPDC049518]|uniref:carbohydrate-binding protein n=1 Tax=unclassified Asanoa TaxID=2685164 RepID=UPI003443E4A4
MLADQLLTTARATAELRFDSPAGAVVGTATPNATTGNGAFAETSVPVSQPAGTHRLYLVFSGVTDGPRPGLVNLNWVQFG